MLVMLAKSMGGCFGWAVEGGYCVMCFLIDMSRLRFLVVVVAELLKKYEEGKLREVWGLCVDVNGEVFWGVLVVVFGGGEVVVIKVLVFGDLYVIEGEMVCVEELMV